MDTSDFFNVHTWKGKIVASTAAVAGVYGLYLVARKPNRKTEVSLEKLTNVLGEFASGIDEAVQFLAKQEKTLRMRMKVAGRPVNEDEVMEYCQHEFQQMIAAKEASIYQKFRTTDKECKRAWQKYRNDETIAKLETRIMNGASIFEKKEVELPDDFSEQKFLQSIDELIEGTIKAMEASLAELEQKGITPQSGQARFLNNFQLAFQTKSDKVQTAVRAKYGMSEEIYGAAMLRYENHPLLLLKMEQLKMEQQRIFEEAGVRM